MARHTFGLLIAGLLLTCALAGGVAALDAMGVPMPWRGALTRHAYAELLHGALPALACEGDSGAFECAGLAADSVRAAIVEVQQGRVEVLRRAWWRPAHAGQALADSVASAVMRVRGGPLRCRMSPELGERGRNELWLLWPGTRDGVVTELRAWSRVPLSSGGPEGWVVSLREHAEAPGCLPV